MINILSHLGSADFWPKMDPIPYQGVLPWWEPISPSPFLLNVHLVVHHQHLIYPVYLGPAFPQTVDMPVFFYIDSEVVADWNCRNVDDVTLSYKFHMVSVVVVIDLGSCWWSIQDHAGDQFRIMLPTSIIQPVLAVLWWWSIQDHAGDKFRIMLVINLGSCWWWS